MILSAALDLGTTGIKGALLDTRGALVKAVTQPAPGITGRGLIRESSPSEYANRAENVLKQLYHDIPDNIPLGISSQRSSFLLWDRNTSKPVTPLISWMDRRGVNWVRESISQSDTLTKNTGLPLSPHYAGPKLASMLRDDPVLQKKAGRGTVLFGTIECYLIWLWSKGEIHSTDITMASRTLMYDLIHKNWSEEKLSIYNIPGIILPWVEVAGRTDITIKRGTMVRAIPADQPSAFYASAFFNPINPVVNLGTGGFVISLCNEKAYIPKGILYAPVYSGTKKSLSYGLEGTINGITASSRKIPGDSADISGPLPPETYCVPDSNGTGSPYWNPTRGLTFSNASSRLREPERRRVLFEGIIFRVAEIMAVMGNTSGEISLYGGLSHIPFFKKGLADCLNRDVRTTDTSEGSLLGAALMAAEEFKPVKQTVSITHPSRNRLLRNKFFRWQEWMKKIMAPEKTT